eukprot:6978992-Prymnesium_polylepis.1
MVSTGGAERRFACVRIEGSRVAAMMSARRMSCISCSLLTTGRMLFTDGRMLFFANFVRSGPRDATSRRLTRHLVQESIGFEG